MKFKLVLSFLAVILAFSMLACAPAKPETPNLDTSKAGTADPNFYVFLAFGQSNMEGYPALPDEYKDVSKYDHRFQMLAAVDFPQMQRTKGQWYDAAPPLCRPGCGLCPADYFGRTLVDNLPKNIKVGVINVSVAGCKIEMFDKANFQAYASTQASWMQNIVKAYDGNPYQKLVDMAKLAQKDGVIKGILLHQGESNSGEGAKWAAKVKGVYDNLIKDLDLKADKTPLLIGELTNGGGAAMIAEAAKLIPNTYVIPSKGCAPDAPRNTIHFAPAGYKELGIRYGTKMCELLGYPVKDAASQPATTPAAN